MAGKAALQIKRASQLKKQKVLESNKGSKKYD
jgi:hypothetical protein